MRAALVLLAPALTAFGCIEDVDLGQFNEQAAVAGSSGVGGVDGGAAGSISLGGTATQAGSAGTGGSGGAPPCEITKCLDRIYACGDCLDNDADGVVDSADSQCLGPCDNTEDSFYNGIPDQNSAPCRQDCYFDLDSGAGNDGCYWSHQCDVLSVPEEYPPSGSAKCAYEDAVSIGGTDATCAELELEQSTECLDYCVPLVPNGCDCFGCCELPAGSNQFVWIGSTESGVGTCDETVLDDPSACRRCTPVPSCFNDCDGCETCVGRAGPDPSCGDPTGNCGTLQACGQRGQEPCPSNTYCITGCCIDVPR